MFRVFKDILIMVGVAVLLVSGFVVVLWGVSTFNSNVKVYNCDIAEISPDFPIKVKEDCRNLRSGRI